MSFKLSPLRLSAITAQMRRNAPRIFSAALSGALAAFMLTGAALAQSAPPGAAGQPYADAPPIAAIGDRVDARYPIPDSAKGPAIDPAKGYRVQNLGDGLYMITDNVYQSMFLVYEQGVVVIDAPPGYAAKIKTAIAEVTTKPITHIIYSHAHIDHIGGAGQLAGARTVVIAQEETRKILVRAHDTNRPTPTKTFTDKLDLRFGTKVLQLTYPGIGHEPGNIYIYAPKPRVLMAVDLVFPGWMPWRNLALAADVPGYYAQIREISGLPWQILVSGHVARTGSHADVAEQIEFLDDLKAAAGAALGSVKPGEGVNPTDLGNPWGLYDDYFDRVAAKCVATLTPKWGKRLAAYDVFIWDQCFTVTSALTHDGGEFAYAIR